MVTGGYWWLFLTTSERLWLKPTPNSSVSFNGDRWNKFHNRKAWSLRSRFLYKYKKIQINLLFKNFQIWYFYHIPTIKFLIPKMYLKCLQRPWTQFLFIPSHDRIVLKNTANETSTILWGPFLAMSKFNTFPAPP